MPPCIGQIATFAGNFVPAGWIPCSGETVPVETFPDLFEVIGYQYGGEGESFTLPKLQDQNPLLTPLILFTGAFPRPGDRPWVPDVLAFAVEWTGDQPPEGCVQPVGQPLPISQNTPLFALLGTIYGGSRSWFALPWMGAPWVFCVEGAFPSRN